MAINKHSIAREYYERLNQAPSADFQMRPAVAIGQAYSAENKPAEALAKFDWVLAQKAGDSELAEYQPDGDSRQGPLPGHHESGRRGDPGRANGDRQGGQGGP